jgi:hypothetical protein
MAFPFVDRTVGVVVARVPFVIPLHTGNGHLRAADEQI